MEVQLASTANTNVILLIIASLFLLILIKHQKRSKAENLPPGPWKLPIIGSMHHLAIGLLPHQTLSKLSKIYGPLMHLKLGQISLVVASSPRMAKAIMETNDLAFADRPSTLATEIMSYNGSEIAFAPWNDHWRQIKKICVIELFSNKRVKSFSFIRESEASKLVTSIEKTIGSPIDLSSMLSLFTSSVICRAAVGENLNGQSSLTSFAAEYLALMGGFNLGDLFPSFKFLYVVSGLKSKLQKLHKQTDTMMDDIIKKRREYNIRTRKSSQGGNEKEDLLDVLLRLHQGNEQDLPITDTNIKAVLLELFIAGTETSATLMEWSMSEMIRNPKVMEKAQSEVRLNFNKTKNNKVGSETPQFPYLNMVVKEALRLHPPGPLLVPRECREACEIDGYKIPIKTKVLVNAWAIGRDPDVWEDADKFIPERFEKKKFENNGKNFEYIPFGSGRRICPGIAFSDVMVELVLCQLLIHFNWKLPNGIKPEEIDMTEASGIAAKKRHPLYLVADINEPKLNES